MHKLIVDANIWIKYARAKDIAPLLNRFIPYQLTPVVNNYLLSEVFECFVENKWMHKKDANAIIHFIGESQLLM